MGNKKCFPRNKWNSIRSKLNVYPELFTDNKEYGGPHRQDTNFIFLRWGRNQKGYLHSRAWGAH